MTRIVVNSNLDEIKDDDKKTLREAIIETQQSDGGTFDIDFEIPDNGNQQSDNTLKSGYFTIPLKSPLPPIFKNNVNINKRGANVVTLLPDTSTKSEKPDQSPLTKRPSNYSDWNSNEIRDKNNFFWASGSILYVGDPNLIHPDPSSTHLKYSTLSAPKYTDSIPIVTINRVNFSKNISRGGDASQRTRCP